MYLKSIEVHGFKSFATKLVFEFHNGITAIVGPNGSGKSNVADAVRWVLGEQSAKQLRGSKMEDVIFAGTEMRKPLGYAYVALTINNEDHKLNVPYEEVKIARRVYRSGESEYLLNGASCRLKDVQELLLDTGIGKEGYSIIGQGQIDKILSGKPEERRELFDEAAGIVKFKKRKAASEKNLEEERQNLTRIEDILSELEKQVGPLKEQSEKARDYLSYRDRLKNLDIHMFLADYDRIHKEMEETKNRQEIASHDLEEAAKEFDQTKEEYIAVERLLEEQNKSLEEKQEYLSENRVSFSTAEGNIKLLEEQISTLKKNKEDSAERLSSLQEKMEAAMQEREGYLKEKGETDKAHEDLLKRKELLQEKIEEKSKKSEELQNAINQCNEDMLSFLDANTDVKADEQRIATLLEQNNIKKAEVTKKILENKTEAAGFEEVLEKEKEAFEAVSKELSGVLAAIDEFRNSIQTIEKENEDMEMEHRRVQKQYHIENSRLESLRNLTERYEGYGQSIQRIMEQKSRVPGIVGVVADIVRVKKEYEVAVETALGGSIRNVVTDNEQTAKEMIGFLKKNRYGRATFLPLTNMKNKPVNLSGNILSEPGVIGMASRLVDADEEYTGLVEYLLGRFVVVDHIDHAIALANKYHHTIRIVTTEGELLNPGGSMSGGAFKNNQNLLGRRREMEDLEQKTNDLKAERDKLREDIRLNEEKKDGLTKQVQAHNKLRQELSIKQNTAKLQYDRAASDLEKNEEDLGLIRLERQEVEEEQKRLEKEIEEIKERVETNEEQSRARKEHMEQMEKELGALRDKLSDEEQKNSTLLLEIQAKEQSVEFADTNLERISETISSLAAELNEAHESEKTVDSTVLSKENEILDAQKKLLALQENIASLENEIQDITKNREALSEQNKNFFEKREELSAHKTDLEKECYRLENQLE
ncbi:MAG: chromosome segregation protein SMC, partial [Lachnospiraceae bacterium]|nr:chromosome segregation protein SMC [Lachnospiraceae bacterium]